MFVPSPKMAGSSGSVPHADVGEDAPGVSAGDVHTGDAAAQAVVKAATEFGATLPPHIVNGINFFGEDQLNVLMALPTLSASCVLEVFTHTVLKCDSFHFLTFWTKDGLDYSK